MNFWEHGYDSSVSITVLHEQLNICQLLKEDSVTWSMSLRTSREEVIWKTKLSSIVCSLSCSYLFCGDLLESAVRCFASTTTNHWISQAEELDTPPVKLGLGDVNYQQNQQTYSPKTTLSRVQKVLEMLSKKVYIHVLFFMGNWENFPSVLRLCEGLICKHFALQFPLNNSNTCWS